MEKECNGKCLQLLEIHRHICIVLQREVYIIFPCLFAVECEASQLFKNSTELEFWTNVKQYIILVRCLNSCQKPE